ncbi:MAG TPA: methyltransferase [Burkholderiales bacterium]|nr:methyltransferase [Burkholderiales bacterium]
MDDYDVALAHGQLSARQLAEGAHGPALDNLATALRLAPHAAPLWAQFGELIRYFSLRHPVPPEVRKLLTGALGHPAVDPGNLVRPITTLALSRADPFDEPLLLRLLEDVVVRDPALERLITGARRRMLDKPLPLPVMTAIAHQCFNTEYVFDETPEERAKVEKLANSLVYACYRPLKEAIPDASLTRRHITEPAEERRLAADIPSLTETHAGVSAAVRAQYEENPYPRWVRMQTTLPTAPLAQVLKEMFPRENTPDGASILVAGCGTGQNAIGTALRFAGANVLAIDFSTRSLGYALRKTREVGLQNVEYRRADILGLGGYGGRFDLIECSGVLHHLQDPAEGLRILAGLRKPGGLMRIGLYSAAGRRQIARARELIAARGFRPDLEGIRACRAALRDDPQFAQIVRNEDFYSASGCRDLLFHVQEHNFTLPQIEAMLARLGLRFLGFEFPDSGETMARFQGRFPGSTSLADWAAFENDYPDTFGRMYQFWAA